MPKSKLTPRKLALLVQFLEQKGLGTASLPIASLEYGRGGRRLSFAQEQLWILHQLEPQSPAYNVPVVLPVRGDIPIDVVERTLAEIVGRHEVLRSIFPSVDGRPVQQVLDDWRPTVAVVDLSTQPFQERQRLFENLRREAAQAPFDLIQGPLLRATLVLLEPAHAALILTLHHIATDGWSMGVLLREFRALSEAFAANRPSALAELPVQYSDYAEWQRAFLTESVIARELEHWKGQLAGISPLNLVTDRARPAVPSYAGGGVSVSIDHATIESLRAVAQRVGATLFTALLSAFNVLLAMYSGQDDIVVGVPTSNRDRPEIQPLIGYFVNMLPLRTTVKSSASVVELLSEGHRTLSTALAHQELPFERLVAGIGADRDASRSPIFQVVFSLLDDTATVADGSSASVSSVYTTRFDLEAHCFEQPDGLHVTFAYSTDLFEEVTVRQFIDQYVRILRAFASSPTRAIHDLELLEDDDRAALLALGDRHAAEYPRELSLGRLFEQQAALRPDNVALECGSVRLTYAVLNARANQIAHALIRHGVTVDDPVGIWMRRSVDQIVALLGIVKAGCAYVAVDPNDPLTRVAGALDDAGVKFVMANEELPPVIAGSRSVIEFQDALGESVENPAVDVPANALAYVAFTSGSTGRPKGVAVPHRGVIRLVHGQEFVRLGPEETILQLAPVHFDASTLEIWGALLHGARLVVYPDSVPTPPELEAVLKTTGVTTLWLTASLYNAIVETAPATLAGIRQLLIGGEALSVPHVERGLIALPATTIINGYGPTENTTFTCCYAIPRDGPLAASVPLGPPIAHTRVYVLDEMGELSPAGVPGELYVGGDGLARGYAGAPRETAARFVPDGISGHAGARLYRTGDRVRWRSDGTLEFLGRRDGQIKLRGFRIELAEVEAALRSVPGVSAAVAQVRATPDGSRLVAWVAAASGLAMTANDIRVALQTRLPGYMVPSQIVLLEALPLTASGKVDRLGLPDPFAAANDRVVNAPPTTDVERTLAAIWLEVLRLPAVGIHENFFDLGGDSIQSIQIVSRAVEAGLQLKPRHLFQHPTIAELAAAIDSRQAGAEDEQDATGPAPLTPIQHWFLDEPPVDAHHFNQAMLLQVSENVADDLLARAVWSLVAHHDALGASFRQENGSWQQTIARAGDTFTLERIALADVSPDEQSAAITTACSRAHASFALNDGQLFKALLLDLGERGRRLLLVAHHLIVDGVSWRLLLDDLQSAYRQLAAGDDVRLPRKTTSYRRWAERLVSYAAEITAQETAYWRDVVAAPPKARPAPSAAPRLRGDVSLSADETRVLLREAPRALNARTDELLLAAVVGALRKHASSDFVRVDLEGHGRSEQFDGIDVTRTVGWFTSVYPVRFAVGEREPLDSIVDAVKRAVREVPNGGIGFGALRYLGASDVREALAAPGEPEVSFNYLGQFDNVVGEDSPFRIAPEPSGLARSPRMRLRHPVEVAAVVFDGALRVEWSAEGSYGDDSVFADIVGEFTRLLHECVKRAQARDVATPAAASIGVESSVLSQYPDAENSFPLTPMQHGMLFHTLLNPSSGVYTELFTCALHGTFAPETFQAAWHHVMSRHQALRSVFMWEGVPEPIQVVRREGTALWIVEDWSDLAPEAQTVRLRERELSEERRAFDVTHGPLMVFTLVRLSARETRFLWTFHHVLLDGWSMAIVFREVADAYDALATGSAVPLEPAAPYSSYVRWLAAQPTAGAETYWRSLIGDVTEPTPLGIDRPPHAGPTESSDETIHLDEASTARLAAAAKVCKVTVNTFLLGVWSFVLSRYSGQNDVLFGMTVSGRPADLPKAGTIVGLFINTVPVRVLLSPNLGVADWLRSIQDAQAIQQEHEHLALVDIARCSGVPPGVQLFESLLVFENYPVDRSRRQTARDWTITGADSRHRSNFPLVLAASPGSQLTLRMIYDTARFDRATIRRVLGHVTGVAERIAAAPLTRVGDLSLIDESERDSLVHSWNPAPTPDARQHVTLVDGFEAQVRRTPAACAVTCEGQTIDYQSLNARANQLARALRARGAGQESTVALCLERSIDLVVAVIGILKSGAAYVPIDPGAPSERARFIASDAGARVVVTDANHAGPFAGLPLQTLTIDGDGAVLAAERTDDLDIAIDADTLAYVIYTSGSTGRPKGVDVTHAHVVRLFTATDEWFHFGAGDVWTLFHSIAFDFSVWELWGALLHGGRLVVVPYWAARSPDVFLSMLATERVTVLNQTPSAFRALAAAAVQRHASLALRYVVFGGEALDLRTLEPWIDRYGDNKPQLINMYGITETTVHVTYRPITAADVRARRGSVIGEPIPDLAVYLRDAGGEPVPMEVRGEIYVGGRGVARGYHGQPRRTAERFVPDPFSAEPGARLYRSGDIARRTDDGDLEYQGRGDHQIKVRGFRIEPGEIESVLQQHPSVQDALVVPQPDADGGTRLVAYVIPDEQTAGPARRLAAWQRSGRLGARHWYELPNGLPVVQLNRNETEFLYTEIFGDVRYLRHGVTLQPGACVVDVGGNIGMFTLFAGYVSPGARIHAFEPIPHVCELLQLNAELHGLDVRAHACALAETDGEASFTFYPNLSILSGRFADAQQERGVVEAFVRNQSDEATTSGLLDELLDARLTAQQVQVPLMTLSQAIARDGITHIDLLKVDVEKSELSVLRGIAASDWPKIRQVIVEVHDADGRLVAIRELLEHQGFTVTVDQDEALTGTELYSLYAVRSADAVAGRTEPAAYPVWASPDRLVAGVRERLSRVLPDYMVPSACVLLDAFPLTANGKLDVRSLPAFETTARVRTAPRTELEAQIANVWCDVLGLKAVGLEDNFFELGGHSLLATKLVARLREACGIDLPLVALFESPVLGDLAASIQTNTDGHGLADEPELVAVSRQEPLPLSSSQLRLWFLEQLDPGTAAYNVPGALRIEGRLDADALQRAFTAIVERHEVLRTRFDVVGGEPVQRANAPRPFPLTRIDLRDIEDEQARTAEAMRLAHAEAVTPFDLRTGGLIRASLIRLDESRYFLLLTLHHIVFDAWSSDLLVAELMSFYRAATEGRPVDVAPLPLQYADFASWHREWVRTPRIQQQLQYWMKQLADCPALDLPLDMPRPAVPSHDGAYLKQRLPASLLAALEQLAQQERATLFMTLLAGFNLMLSRYSGQSTVVVGTPVAVRPRQELEGLIGFFSNTLVVRTELEAARSFRDVVRHVRDVAIDAFANQDVPFERVVEAAQPERHLDRHPLFQVLFTAQHASAHPMALPGLRIEPLDLERLKMRFDLEVHVAETADGMLTAFYYNTDVFEQETVARLSTAFGALLQAVADAPDADLREVDLTPTSEAREVWNWNATRRPARFERPLHELVEQQAARTPAGIAVEFRGQTMTYAALNGRANQLARWLRANGVGIDDRVAVAVPRGLTQMVSVLAVMKAGAGYVPLDLSYPSERLAYMLTDSGAKVALTDRPSLLGDADAAGNVPRFLDPEDAALDTCDAHDLEIDVGLDNLAYVLYTSGSTGRPKGIAMPHRALLNLLEWQIEVSGPRVAGRTVQYAPLSFDPSFLEMFSTWSCGGTLIVIDEDLRRDFLALIRFLDAERIERIYITPAALQQLAEASQVSGIVPRLLTEINAAGERLEITPQIAAMAAQIDGCTMFNQYGPAETHVVTAEKLDSDVGAWPALPLIGPALPNTQLRILDGQLRAVPVGAWGELYIAGDNLARGYLGKPRLTAERFVPDPGPDAEFGGRLYRTGDRTRYRAGGVIEYGGRVDHQVKIRGYRIEPGEIEAVLTQHPTILDAAVDVRDLGASGRHVIACVVLRAGEALDIDDVRRHAARHLPDYMIPSFIEAVSALPLTPSGKIDRRALPTPTIAVRVVEDDAARTGVEARLLEIWREILGVESVGIHDDFFAIGGHSLLAAQVASRVRREWGVEFRIRTLFEASTVALLAERLQSALGDQAEPPVEAVGAGREEGFL